MNNEVNKGVNNSAPKKKIEALLAYVYFSSDIEKTLNEEYKGWTVYNEAAEHEEHKIDPSKYKSLEYAYVPSIPMNDWENSTICIENLINSFHGQDKGFGTHLVLDSKLYHDLFEIVGDYETYSVHFYDDKAGYETVVKHLLDHGYKVRTLVVNGDVSAIVELDGTFYWLTHEEESVCK